MEHVMVDIETMGNKAHAPITTIAACVFNPQTGKIGKTFSSDISLASNIAKARRPDSSTILWWMQQEDAAREQFKLNHKAPDLETVLNSFKEWFNKDYPIWGNGIGFDCTIIKTAYQQFGIDVPWNFWNERDVRTMVALGLQVGINPKKQLPFEGVKHCALDDAKHQAKYVSAIWQELIV